MYPLSCTTHVLLCAFLRVFNIISSAKKKRVCKLNFYLYAFGGECIDNNNPNCMVLATYVIKKHSSLV